MTHVVLFHHVLGLTEGVRRFAERLAGSEHTVHTPDLFDGQVAPTLEAGMAIADSLPEDVLGARIDAAIADLPDGVVVAGISWGVMTAQPLAQTREGVRGALLYEACVPVTGEWAFGPWPTGLPVQVHGMEDDPFFGHEGDLDAARQLLEIVGHETAEVFTYPGDQHLFTDSSLPSYDEAATALVLERSRALLDRVGSQ
ncbi:MAG: dienelactone hydrolase family protein [Nocardioides sp.]|nr:dienelactone hydrolase family protein [Nocardioides sp.]